MNKYTTAEELINNVFLKTSTDSNLITNIAKGKYYRTIGKLTTNIEHQMKNAEKYFERVIEKNLSNPREMNIAKRFLDMWIKKEMDEIALLHRQQHMTTDIRPTSFEVKEHLKTIVDGWDINTFD